MEIIAKLKALQPVVEREKFKSRKVWVVVPDEKYPQTLEFELHQDKVSMLDNIGIGAEVKFYLNLKGKEVECKDSIVRVFNSLVCWKVEALSSGDIPTAQVQTAFPAAALPEHTDDLPF